MVTRPIVVGADGSEESLRAVEWAAIEAARRMVPLRIVSVTEAPVRAAAPCAFPANPSPALEPGQPRWQKPCPAGVYGGGAGRTRGGRGLA